MNVRTDRPADAARTVRRLAVLLQAGIAPPSAWGYLAETDPVAARIADRIDDGADVVDAIADEGGAWADVAAAWEVATVVGAPLAPSLRTIGVALEDAQAAIEDARVAMAEPAASARLMLWLPIAGLIMGAALGFDTIGVIVSTPIGLACLGLGLTLVVLARWWMRNLVRRATRPKRTPGLDAELTAIAISGGVSTDRAVAIVADATIDARTARGNGTKGIDDEIDDVLHLSRSAGVPAVDLLRASAAQQRHTARTDARLAASRLATRLLLPLAVCTLPAFLLLGVAPMLLSVILTTDLAVLGMTGTPSLSANWTRP